MSDTISRQAAIDAINKAFERVFAWDGTSPLGDKVLENVPSAQPDIILCPNCRYNDGTAYCELHYRDVKAKDFCSWAERRE